MTLPRKVDFWPGAPPLAQDGVFVIATPNLPGGQRDAARRRIRLAVQQLMAKVWQVTLTDIAIESVSGQMPRLRLNGAISAAGLSISHDDTLSLAAINLHGAVGIDHMQIQLFPDWYSVASDYLGAAVVAQLMQCAPAQRGQAFARAWTTYEAKLKCQGLMLSEWQPETPSQMARCRYLELALPTGLIGTLAVLASA